MTIKWRPPAHDGGAEIFNYVLEKQDRLSTRWIRVTQDEITATEFTVKGLTHGTEYQFRVSAENKAGVGKPSPPSEALVAKPAFGKYHPCLTSPCRFRVQMTGQNFQTFSNLFEIQIFISIFGLSLKNTFK